MSELTFPPLLSGLAVQGEEEAFASACMRATLGCDAGLVVYNLSTDQLQAAMVLAPEVPLKTAMTMLPLCAVGFQNALGALAPPEVALHLEWDGGLRLNGAKCGRLRVAASTTDPEEQPDWLVVGIELPLWPASEETGLTPDVTALYAEGCADVAADALVEAWARHTLNWIARWEDEGGRALHDEWRGLALDVGEPASLNGLQGHFLGVDEDFGMLLRDAKATHVIPLTTLLESQP